MHDAVIACYIRNGLRNNLRGDICKLVVDYDCGSFKVTFCDCGVSR